MRPAMNVGNPPILTTAHIITNPEPITLLHLQPLINIIRNRSSTDSRHDKKIATLEPAESCHSAPAKSDLQARLDQVMQERDSLQWKYNLLKFQYDAAQQIMWKAKKRIDHVLDSNKLFLTAIWVSRRN